MLSLNEPKNSDIHTICDFWELLCLLTPDQECSLDYLNDFVADYRDNGRRAFSDDELSDVLAQAIWREGAFGHWYPFSVDIDGLISAADPLTVKQQFYFFLLICSNLAFVSNRTHWQPLTDAFERASHSALTRMWPSSGVAVPFGKNTTGYTVSGAPTPPSVSARDLRFSPCSVFGWEVLHGALSGGSQSD